ncbi:MAG: DEAD/DEAH box helicase family protein, partial [Bifidobacteriaceae bacterium]|jgi:superfamily II DNA or RNA helicase|nr:DEAD/DEAH box helicase family protein [Bifidobacteriaceae bacterium]
VRRKAHFRSNRTDKPMQQFAVVDDAVTYQPLQGFTSADLGYEPSDAVSNIVTKLDDNAATREFLDVFDAVWNDPKQVADVTEAVADAIAAVYAENAPEAVYFLVLYNVFSDFLEDVSDDTLPNEATGYRDSAIWQALYPFQRDAATGIINKLETYGGCVLADSVGLGKTFTALAVIKYYEARNRSVLVLVPKRLEDNWSTYTANLRTNPFATDRFNYDLVAHTDLSRAHGKSTSGMDLSLVNWGNYDLLVIDESHAFRNAKPSGSGPTADGQPRETRYQRLMREVIRAGVKTKVLMLSATPVNNRFTDLRNQLALAYEGDSAQLTEQLDLDMSVEEVFRRAQRVFNDWSKLPADQRTTERILHDLDFDFFKLLDGVTIARSRKHVQAFYDTSEIGTFPVRRPPESARPALTDLTDVPTFEELFAELGSLKLAVYTPMRYLHPSRATKYQDRYDPHGQGSLDNLRHSGRETGLQRLMTVNLLKRLESSVEAFRITLGKLAGLIERTVVAIDEGAASIADPAGAVASSALDTLDADAWETDDDADAAGIGLEPNAQVGGRYQIALADIDCETWRRDLADDAAVIARIRKAMDRITPDHDVKLRELRRRLKDKTAHPFNPGNRKALIFTAFADTAAYLYRELAPALSAAGLNAAVVTGGGRPRSTLNRPLRFQEALTLFSPRSKNRTQAMPKEPREIDVLIGTDCVSEGQNLQDCDYVVNYDIHWNPVRIIQRFGRVDRIGSANGSIQLVNFWPDMDLDEYLNLEDRVRARMVAANVAATGDENLLAPESPDTEFRKEQLRRLQDEVIDLEDVRTGVSITDLGLNDFRIDLLEYARQHPNIGTWPKGLHTVVPANPEIGLVPGVIFALRNTAAGPGIGRGNQLHPHYLVYLDRAGSVVADHTQVKQLLDLMRASCRPYPEPIGTLCHRFNRETADGARMDAYSRLLSQAVDSMISRTVEADIDSLFTPGPTTALAGSLAGLDDFELTAFVVVMDPDEAGRP